MLLLHLIICSSLYFFSIIHLGFSMQTPKMEIFSINSIHILFSIFIVSAGQNSFSITSHQFRSTWCNISTRYMDASTYLVEKMRMEQKMVMEQLKEMKMLFSRTSFAPSSSSPWAAPSASLFAPSASAPAAPSSSSLADPLSRGRDWIVTSWRVHHLHLFPSAPSAIVVSSCLHHDSPFQHF